MPSNTYNPEIHTHVNAARFVASEIAESSVNDYACQIVLVSPKRAYFIVDAFAFADMGDDYDNGKIEIIEEIETIGFFYLIACDLDLCVFYTQREKDDEANDDGTPKIVDYPTFTIR